MPLSSPEIIFPCPLSKGYGIPAQQAWLLLRIYLIYRLVLASLFIMVFYNQWGASFVNIDNMPLYRYTSHAYLLLSALSAIGITWRLTAYNLQAQLMVLSDIVALTLLMHACGGVNSGMGTLLGVTIASGGLLIGGGCAMLFAAMSTLAVLAEQVFANYTGGQHPTNYTYAGMLGASFFTIATLSYILARRSEQSLVLTNQQKNTIIKLEELNQYIIQHLQSGIIIVNDKRHLQMANEAALRLLKLSDLPTDLDAISGQLTLAFDAWLTNPEQDSVMLKLVNGTEIYSRFMPLPTVQEFFYMLIFEDIVLYNQRVQQSKLASLGRLTASIAHEIRNPLSAISHAGQLLSENQQLSDQDLRLTEIIQTNSRRVNYIIEDILQLSKRANSQRRKIYLTPWLKQYIYDFTTTQNLPSTTFNIVEENERLCAYIDPGHLKQIMNNLCQNALNYGKPSLGSIMVRILSFHNSPCIEIIDNGSGVNHEHINHLFEPFFTTSSNGTGLGLYISRELAELNQAKLSYHLTNGSRSCFRLCLQDANHTLIEI